MSTVAVAGSPNNPQFAVIDFSNPGGPLMVTPSFQGACQVKQNGASAYVGNQLGGQVQLFDISNPAAPIAHGTAPTVLAGIGAIAVRGTRVVVGEATNTFKARICLIDFSSPGSPVILGYAPTPLVSVATSPTETLAAISSLAFIEPNLVVASGPANFIIAIADFTNLANPTVTTFNPHAGPPCLDADENVQRIVTGDTNASWVRLYDTGWHLLATANSTLNSVDYTSLSGLRALAGSNNTFQVALIDFSGTTPQVTTFDPQMGGGSCTSIKGTRGCCGAVLGSNVKLFDLTVHPPTPLGNAITNLGGITSLDMGIVAPVFVESPTSLVFGAVRVGTKASETLTISNTGNAPLSITGIQSSSPIFTTNQSFLTISPGTNSPLVVAFAPNAEAPFTGNLTMQTNDPNHPTVTIVLSGIGSLPHIKVSSTRMDFGGIYAACQSGTAALIIQNTGGIQLTIISISTSGPPFSVTSTNALIPPGGSFSVTVTFTPTAVGTANGSLMINSDDPTNPQLTVALQGSGLPAQPPTMAVTPTSLNFGSVLGGASQGVTIANTSACQTLTATLNTTGPFFIIQGPVPMQSVNTTIGPQSSGQFLIAFKPTAGGPVSSTLVITTNDPLHPTVTIPLSGFGVLPVVQAAAPLSDGRLELWVTDTQGHLFTTWKLTADPNANWAPWDDFLAGVGGLPAGAQQVAVAPLSDGRLELWVIDTQGHLFTTWKLTTDPNANWAPWDDFLAEVGV